MPRLYAFPYIEYLSFSAFSVKCNMFFFFFFFTYFCLHFYVFCCRELLVDGQIDEDM